MIDDSFDYETDNETESNLLHLMIKHYDDGQFTSILNKIDLSKHQDPLILIFFSKTNLVS